MKKVRVVFLLSLLSLIFLSLTKPISKNQNIVVLLSFDGVRWDSIESVNGFLQIEKSGFKVKKMRSVFPSLTFPAHSSISTGTFPRKHGIVSSVFLEKNSRKRFSDEKEAEWLLVPPLWVLVEKAGLKSAVCAWPLSYGRWKEISPSIYLPYTDNLTDKDIEEWVLKCLTNPTSPNLIMAWFHGADYSGHKFGPKSIQYKEAVQRSGRIVERIVMEIKKSKDKKITLMVTSDHGMTEVINEIDIVQRIPKKSFFPYIAISGPVANIYVDSPKQFNDVKDSLKFLKKNLMIFEKLETPFELSTGVSSRSGDFLVICNGGEVFQPYKMVRKEMLHGTHGYPPSNLDMCGIFLAFGEKVPNKAVEEACIVDIAPTVLKILNVEGSESMDGKALF